MDNSTSHFITTRPINRATNLITSLSAISTPTLPISVKHYPLIDILDYYDDQFLTSSSEINLFGEYSGAIFISGNAVDYAKKQLDSAQWQQLISTPLFAIGEQTAKVLQAEILQAEVGQVLTSQYQAVKFPSIMNSEGLLAMQELDAIKGQTWLIVKGVGGRDKLKSGLKSKGANVSELSVYERKLPDLMAQKAIAEQSMKPCIWLITSSQALNNLYRILNRVVQNCRIIVSGDRISNEAKKLGFKVVAQSLDATDKQLTECVKQFVQKND